MIDKGEGDAKVEEEPADENHTVYRSEAFYVLEMVWSWYERPEECVSTQHFVLKQLQNVAALKRQSSHCHQ